MKEQIEELIKNCDEEIASATLKDSADELKNSKVRFLGKSGMLTALLRGMKDVPANERPIIGQLVNQARERMESRFIEAEKLLKLKLLERSLKAETVDITENLNQVNRGTLHPLTLVNDLITNIFVGMGFEVHEGPEVETDYYNFQALNLPKDHPARDMQDTFYITEELLLRTHTSPCQVRTMEIKKPPIKVICPGKVYRNDDDTTHSPIFSQIEGLVVDKGITLCDLKGTLEEFAKALFSSETKTRLRPSFFPFTEPSVEVDLSCTNCHGKGCKLCKGTGWMEVLGAGMVHPFVLENCGIDSKVYSGFAFGMGIERIAMIRYGIPDIRLHYENDVRYLRQFKG